MQNPFDILPPGLFNVFSSMGNGSLQRHYMAILLRLYALAEFNRFGLAREVVMDEIVHYLKESNAEAEIAVEMAAQPTGEPDSVSITGQKSEQDYASYLIRRLADSGWVEREQHADYSETIILPDYAFTLLEALRTIQEQKPREFTGQIYAAHQLITSANTNKDFSPCRPRTRAAPRSLPGWKITASTCSTASASSKTLFPPKSSKDWLSAPSPTSAPSSTPTSSTKTWWMSKPCKPSSKPCATSKAWLLTCASALKP